MPTRQRNTVSPYNSAYTAKYRKVPTPFTWNTAGSPSNGTRASLDETIVDANGSDGRFRPCLHTKFHHRYIRVDEGGDPLFVPGTYRVEYQPVPEVSQLVGPPAWPDTTAIKLTSQQWEEQDSVALGHMLPSLSDNFSLVNFLIEMKDFRGLVTAFGRRKNRLKTVLLGETGTSNGLRATLRERPLTSLSNAYLQYSFAWRPFVQDLISIWKKLKNVELQLEEIWRRQGQPQTRHYSIPLYEDWQEVTADALEQNIDTRADGVARDHSLRLRSSWTYVQAPVYSATCRFTYQVPGALDTAARVRGWSDAFGIRLDPSIIWNAIPFSFIVDWVVGVGNTLGSLSTDNLGLKVIVEDFCSSQKVQTITTREAYIRRTNLGGSFTSSASSVPVSTHTSSFYERRTTIPSLYQALVGSDITLREASLGGALVLANRRPTS